MSYATPAQYRATPGAPAVDDDALLAQRLQDASDALDGLLIGATYPVDAAGEPTTAGVASLFRRLTIAQAVYATANPDTQSQLPAGAGTLGPLTIPAAAAQSAEQERYAPALLTGLAASGLLTTRVLGVGGW
jgi:hypothetical protein